MSSDSYKEILATMNEFVETPILESAKDKFFILFIDETTAGTKSVANVFIMFGDGNEVKEHYLGTVNMNAGLGLTAKHFYKAAQDLCSKKGINLENCVFSEMDGCSTNQGKRKGLKLYFNPHHISESCGSHKIALLPQKLVVEGPYPCLKDADSVAVGLSAIFKISSLRSAILENTQKVLKQKVRKLISPSSTRWLSHLHCSERLTKVLLPVLHAMNAIYLEKDDINALGFMMAVIRPEFLLSCLALHDVFQALSLLIHWLQTSPSNADITRVPVLVKKTADKLLYLAGDETKESLDIEKRKFTPENYRNIHQEIKSFVKSTPVASSSRKRRIATDSEDIEAVFENFKDEVFAPFAEEMAENIIAALELDPVCGAFGCLDAKNFPKSEADLNNFGKEDLEVLIGWYGAVKHGEYPGDFEQVSSIDPVINPKETRTEYRMFKNFLLAEQKKFKKEIAKALEACERNLDSIRKITTTIEIKERRRS